MLGRFQVVRKRNKVFAVIHIGSELIRMQIIEYQGLDKQKILEDVQQKVRLGEEAFKNKKVPFPVMVDTCNIVKGFKRLMDDYGVSEYVGCCTTAVREADNQAYFLDQLRVKTGLSFEVVDMPREIFIKFSSIIRTVTACKQINPEEGVLFVDISSGGLGITLLRKGEMVYQQNLHIGIIRLKENFNRNQRSNVNFGSVLNEYISSALIPVREALQEEMAKYLVLSGTETELVLKAFGKLPRGQVESLKIKDFREFYARIRKMSLNQIVKNYGVAQESAELVWPTITLYQQLLSLVNAKDIFIVPDSFTDGMKTLYIAHKADQAYLKRLEGLLISGAHCIGKRYRYDRKHAVQVEKLALTLFDALRRSHGLDDRDRLLLQMAAILHDVGKYICLRSHVHYSYELIMSSDLLGFSMQEKKIIALTAFYHANLLYETQTADNPQVERDIVPRVAKLASILRLADAMDRSYMQKIKSAKVEIHGNEMRISAKSKEDLTLEEWSFANKADFFEEVYGLDSYLERVSGEK